jgi:hypothetical protein
MMQPVLNLLIPVYLAILFHKAYFETPALAPKITDSQPPANLTFIVINIL